MLLTLYFIVVEWFRNVKDIKDADITTPVHANRLWDCLEGNPNRDFIVSGFKSGFRIGICRSPNVPVNNINIGRLKTKNRKAVIDKLNVELSQGRILGPFSYPPLDYATYSPLYAIPKSEPGKYRLIHDLSKPAGCSVNENIPDNLKTVYYCTVMQVAEFLKTEQELGQNSYHMAKVDLKDAYRCCPIHKEDWRYLGMQFEDKFLIDTCLPMGLGTSCKIFQSISDSLCWIFRNEHPECKIFSYLDDFLVLAPTKEQCQTGLSGLLHQLEYLGFPVSPSKTVSACTHIEFLGLGLDCKTMSFFVPDKKREKITAEIDKFLSSKSQRVHAFQKLVGKLTFLCMTFLPGKALLSNMYHSLSGVLSSQGWAQRRITNDVRSDLAMWKSFLAQTEGKPFRFVFPSASDTTMTSDASGAVGYGCVMERFWFSGLWNDEWWSKQNIALLELIPIYIGTQLWMQKLSNSTITVLTDNESLVAMINTFFSRERTINKALKYLAAFCMNHNIVLQAHHLAGKNNVLADKLSRNMECSDLLPENNIQCEIPDHLLPSAIKHELIM